MKDAPFTTPPIVSEQNARGKWKHLLLGHAASDAYYEALDPQGRWYLWTEVSRFGTVRAYPCALTDGGETFVFRPYGDNADFFDRWQSLITEETVHALQITEHSRTEFQKIYRSLKEQ